MPLNVMDIQELALRNLALRLPEDEQGVGLIYLQHGEGMIILEKDSSMYLSRKFDLDIQSFREEQTGSNDLLQGNLVLEIQRSLDYYERQFGMTPISGLVVSPLDVDMERLFGYLNNNLGTSSRVLDISVFLPCERKIDEAEQWRCLPAIGTALGIKGN